ncbi:MAG TPA: HEAT repeat domain-containing protein, partial [Lentisphaeria bacterium]|nr:HEAT repeat domain-containing protein [Lentisphaeria bacterium]
PSMMALMDNTEEDEGSVPYLLSMVASEDKVVRKAAANILIEGFVGSSVTEAVVSFYQQHNGSSKKPAGLDLRQTLIRVLGLRGDVAARPFLMSLLHDPDAAIRKSTMEAIENLMGPLDRRVLAATILK